MHRYSLCLPLLLAILSGCHHYGRRAVPYEPGCGASESPYGSGGGGGAPNCHRESTAQAPPVAQAPPMAQAPANLYEAPLQTGYAAPMLPAAGMLGFAPAPAASPSYAVSATPQDPGMALGMGKLEICIPFPKLIPVPRAPKLAVVQTVPQSAAPTVAAPMMAAPMYGAPMMAPAMMPAAMMAPPVAAIPPAAAPSCKSSDEQALAALMLLSAQQKGGAQASPDSSPSTNQQALEEQTTRLEQRLDALVRKLEENGDGSK